ncbi:MAG: hypothetical protein JKY24_03630 [Pseudomonadales bacterium]|nr:hypothetical protein [Pseudomonadales bacterium]
MMDYKLTALLPTLLIATISTAEANTSYTCTHQASERKIEIVYENMDGNVPCKVEYTKENAGEMETQILWSAQAEVGYCEVQTNAFIEKQEGWGWDCNEDVAAVELEAAIEAPMELEATVELDTKEYSTNVSDASIETSMTN